MKFKVGDLLHYKKQTGLNISRYMLVAGYDIKEATRAIDAYAVYVLLDVHKGNHFEWSEMWVDSEFVLAQ